MKFKSLLLLVTAVFSITIFIASTDKHKTITPPDEKIADAFFSFAKTYGYIRYFYPGDEVADLDWDRFAWYGADVIAKTDDMSIDKQIRTLFSPIVGTLQIEKDVKKIKNLYANQVLDTANAVYWQHLGDGKERISYPYMSMRVNRPVRKLPESPNDFASIRKTLDIQKYQGKKIRLTGKVKVNAAFIGRAYLVVSVKEVGKDRKPFSTEGQPIQSGIWTNHTITVQLPENIEQLVLVCEPVIQTGGVFYDDLCLETEIDGKWQKAELFDFENTNSESFKSDWRQFGPNQDISLKKDDANNSFAFFSRTLGVITQVSPLFQQFPDQEPFVVKGIGAGWSIGFPLVLQQSNNRAFTTEDSLPLNNLRRQLSKIRDDQLQIPHLPTRIANIIIIWNRLQHFHPDNPYSTAEWENELRKAIKKSFKDKTIDDHRSTLTQMVRGLKDSHMTFYIADLYRTRYYFPFKWEWIENKLVITKVLAAEPNLKIGDIIEMVDGVPADQYWKKIKTNVIGATSARQEFKAVEESLSGEKGTQAELSVFSKSGIKNRFKVQRTVSEFEYNKSFNSVNKLEQYQQIKPGIFYVNLFKMVWDDLKTHIEELSKAKGIIFDLRGYPNARNIEIVSHFITDSIQRMTLLTPQVIYPDRSKNSYRYEYGAFVNPKLPYIKAKKVFLTNGSAMSYAETYMELIEYYKLATIIGDYTAGTTGNTNMVYLFGGLSIPWTGMRVLKQDGTPFNGKGVKPDIIVRPTIQNIKEGKDDCIEYVMKNILN